jgi:hypothetical protein
MVSPPFEVLDCGGGVDRAIVPLQKSDLGRQFKPFWLENQLEPNQSLHAVGCMGGFPAEVSQFQQRQ